MIKSTRQNRNKDSFLNLTKGIYEKSIPDFNLNDYTQLSPQNQEKKAKMSTQFSIAVTHEKFLQDAA